jgi:two-component system chemotaxis response regulator CheY
MPLRVLDVGQCVPDHAAIRRLLESKFAAQVVQTHGMEDTLAELQRGQFALVLVNRKLDADYSDGMEIIKRIKADPQLSGVAVMLVSNYPDAQQQAVAIGAEMGFGKAQLTSAETHERLKIVLSKAAEQKSA